MSRATERFELKERLGQGAFGVVWRAYDRERRQLVALKQLRTLAPDALFRFKAEFRALQDLNHPNVVHFHELFEDEGRWFFTMELVEGVELLEWVGVSATTRHQTAVTQVGLGRQLARAEGTPRAIDRGSIQLPSTNDPSGIAEASPPAFDEDRIRRAFVQLAGALAALHGEGLVHRDVKPSNVRVTPEGRVVLLDFGLVTPTSSDEAAIVGTPAYMAPEQCRGAAVGAEADAYAFGVVLYEALTGRLPLAGTAIRLLLLKQSALAPRVRSRAPHVSEELDVLVAALLDPDPAARPTLLDARRRLGPSSSRPGTSPTPEPPFLGRDRELDELRARWADVRRGAFQAAVVEGESGVGKSSLVDAFTRELAETGAHVLQGRCYERETVPYKAFDGVVDALSALLRRLDDETVAASLPTRVGLLPLVFPVLGQVPAISLAPPPSVEGLDVLQLRDSALGALRELLAGLARRLPIVLVVDDLQWSDEESLRVLDELAFASEPPPLLLLTTVRPLDGECPRSVALALQKLAAREGNLRLSLTGLADEDARGLVERLLQLGEGAGLDVDEITAQAQGHPLFLAELVRHVQRSMLRGRRTRVDLDEALRERVLDLPPALRELLSSICLATRPLPREVVFDLAGGDDEGDRAVKTLRVARLVRASRRGDEGTLEPFHDRVRGATVAVLGEERARALHTRLARVIERRRPEDAESLYAHCRGAGERVRAAEHALVAGRRAAASLAFHRAAQLLSDALELAAGDAPIDRPRVRVELADALRHAGRGAEAAAIYEAAVADADTPDEARRLRLLATQTYLQSGRLDTGMRLASEVLEAVGVSLSQSRNTSLASMLYHRACLRLTRLEPPPALGSRDEVVRLDTVGTVGTVLSMVDFIRGAELQARALRLALRFGDRERFVRALATEAAVTGCTEDPPMRRAGAMLARAQREADASGDPYLRAFVALSQASAELAHYRFRETHDHAAFADALLREHCSGVPWELSTAHHLLGMSAWNLGRYRSLAERAPRWVREARERSDLYGTTTITTSSMFALAIAEDRPDEGIEAVHAAMAEWAQPPFQIQHYFEMQSLTDLEIYAGRGRAAHERQVRDWPAFRRSLLPTMPTMRFLMLSSRARAALARARDDASERAALVAAASKDLKAARRAMRQPVNTAMADQIEAEVHAARGDRARAEAALTAAIGGLRASEMLGFAAAAALRLGVLRADEREIAEAEGELLALGVRAPRKYAWLRGPGVWE
ncbi:MAG: protein kinase [Myxococcales bacterium]|nr:protein kinase [Myxococcales bacterium]